MKKIWTILLLLCFALCVETCAEGFEFTLAGEGTAENPYLIASAEDLMQFASVMNDEKQYIDYYDCHFRLAADIVLNDCSDFDGWSENPPENVWTPIGYYHGFKGVFDGNGHTVSGLYIDQPITEIEYDGYSQVMDKFGLFGTVGGEVKNLTIQNAFVCPKDVRLDKGESLNVGILAGSSSGVIRNCRVEGVVICEGGDCGGIVGSGSEIIDCSFQGKIIEKAGGKVNYIGGIAGSGSNIRGCGVSAQIICAENEDKLIPHATIGGLVGICQAFGRDDVIEDCTFDGEIMSGDYAGGIVGLAGARSFRDVGGKTIIRNCTNNGSITAMEDAGGIVGLAFRPRDLCEIRLDGCINRGEVKSLDTETCAVGGIVGHIDTNQDGLVSIVNCINETALHAHMPGGIVGRIMQNTGNVRIEKCTNKGTIYGEGTYAAGILCHIQQWGGNWSIVIDQCMNEGDIHASRNAGGIVCFAYSVGNEPGCELTISNCANRGNLRSEGTNNYMGGILGVDTLAYVPVNITGCTNEGDLEYTSEVLVNAETLSGALVTLSRTSGGIVGYVGTAPYFTLNSGERTLNNINVEDAYLSITNCASTGRFIHKDARFADDVSEDLLEKWRLSGVQNPLNYFIALEGGILGTISDQEAYSVSIADCRFENIERAYDDWNLPHDH